MFKAALNPNLIRALLIVLFLVFVEILRAAKNAKTAKPTAPPGAAKGIPLGATLRDAMRQSADQPGARQGEPWANVERSQMREQLQQPPTIQPESSFLPSLLLLALLVCLCLMAYRYWAG